MNHPNLLWRVFGCLIAAAVIGCAHQGPSDSDRSEPTMKKTKEMMRIAFTHPVVMVNGVRAKQGEGEYEEKIELSYPQDSTQKVTLVVIADGEEQTVNGEMEVYHYSEQSKVEEGENPLVWVAPKNPEYVYADIIRNGYGELTILEKIRSSEGVEVAGPAVLKMKLGTKKKSNPDEIEFRFREGAVHTINGATPGTYAFVENSRQRLDLTIDEGSIRVRGDLEVYRRTHYTDLAPVWIALPEDAKDYLRGRGGSTELALSVPATTPSPEEEYVRVLDPGKETVGPASQDGRTVVALLKLRRIQ